MCSGHLVYLFSTCGLTMFMPPGVHTCSFIKTELYIGHGVETVLSALTMCWSWALWDKTQKVQALSTLYPLTNNCTLRLETHGHHFRGNRLSATNKTVLPTTATGPFCPRELSSWEMEPVWLGEPSSFTQDYYVRSSNYL